MKNVFWVGVFPGLTREMLDYIANTMIEFATSTREGLRVLSR